MKTCFYFFFLAWSMFFVSMFTCAIATIAQKQQVRIPPPKIRIEDFPNNISFQYKYSTTSAGEIQNDECYLLWDVKNQRIKSIKLSDDPEEKKLHIHMRTFMNGVLRFTGCVVPWDGKDYRKESFLDPLWVMKKTTGGMLILPKEYKTTPDFLFHCFFYLSGRFIKTATPIRVCNVNKVVNINGFVIPVDISGECEYEDDFIKERSKTIKEKFHITIDIKNLKINQPLSDKMFELKIPVGANVIDDIRGITYRADGLDTDGHHIKIDEVLEDVLKEAEEQKGTARPKITIESQDKSMPKTKQEK